MSRLSLGIVGLPNVGKSTLFNALVRDSHAEASNYPFCTIDPNVALVEVPDKRLETLKKLVSPESVIPAVIEFTDIAGIIKGASKGEGLGNQFLAHIRETAAIMFVVRCFTNNDIIHVDGSIDPKRDLETVFLELALADLETVTKAKDRYARSARGGDATAKAMSEVAELLYEELQNGGAARDVYARYQGDQTALSQVKRELQLLTGKPYLVVANVSEDMASLSPDKLADQFGLASVISKDAELVPICAQLEAELNALDADDQTTFLAEYGLKESGLVRLTQAAYKLLGLETFFTAGVKEVRAWTMPAKSTAPQAAGVIHTDFEKGFIRAEVIAYEDFEKYGSEQAAKEAGKLKSEGKEYVMKDGDVVHFRFNV